MINKQYFYFWMLMVCVMETVRHLVVQAKTAEGVGGDKVQPIISNKGKMGILQPTGQTQPTKAFVLASSCTFICLAIYLS
jgi:hypothetical protein